MKACLTYAPMIGSREGELSAEESRALAAHLAECRACAALAARTAAMDGLLGEVLLAQANARDFGPFVDQVMARIERGPAGRRAGRRAWSAGLSLLRRRWMIFTAAAVAVVAALSVFMYVEREAAEPEQLASLEVDLDGGSIVLQTADGPVVLLEPEDGGS